MDSLATSCTSKSLCMTYMTCGIIYRGPGIKPLSSLPTLFLSHCNVIEFLYCLNLQKRNAVVQRYSNIIEGKINL